MKKYIKITLLFIILSPLAFFVYEGIRLKIIYEGSKMIPISINSNSYSNLLNDFYSGMVLFNDAYLVEKTDTLISFEIDDKAGLLWIISGLDYTSEGVDYIRQENLTSLEDGTFKNYSISKKPIIRVAYNKEQDKLKGQCKLVCSYRSIGELFEVRNTQNVRKIIFDSLEFRNENNELFYRVDCGLETELYTFMKGGSMYCVFFQ